MNVLLKEMRFSLRPGASLQGVGSAGHFRDWGKMLCRWEGSEVLSLTWNQQFPFSVLPRRESFLWKARHVFTCSLLHCNWQFGCLLEWQKWRWQLPQGALDPGLGMPGTGYSPASACLCPALEMRLPPHCCYLADVMDLMWGDTFVIDLLARSV